MGAREMMLARPVLPALLIPPLTLPLAAVGFTALGTGSRVRVASAAARTDCVCAVRRRFMVMLEALLRTLDTLLAPAGLLGRTGAAGVGATAGGAAAGGGAAGASATPGFCRSAPPPTLSRAWMRMDALARRSRSCCRRAAVSSSA